MKIKIATLALILTVTTIMLLPKEEVIATPAPAPAVCQNSEVACLIEKRTKEIFERDLHLYQEEARLNAMLEINSELQSMVYPN